MNRSNLIRFKHLFARSFATEHTVQPRHPAIMSGTSTNIANMQPLTPTCYSIPAVLMRAGTSKGLFIHRQHLPPSPSEWAKPLLAIMGSQGSDNRQIDGIGGATSTTSKVAVISPSSREGIDVEYTFVQVAVGQEVADLSGNCGNIASGVGPFALQEGLVKAAPGSETIDVRVFNTNTSRLLVSTLQLDLDGSFREAGPCYIPGVKSPGSEVKVAFVDPAGSMTGVLFPTGQRSQLLPVAQRHHPSFSVRVTLVDAANPFVLVDGASLPHYLRSCPPDAEGYLDHMEAIRRAGAVTMGLANSIQAASKVRGTPKLAIVYPAQMNETSNQASDKTKRLRVQAFSMGKPHPSLQLTGAVCIASATCVEGTVAHQVALQKETIPGERSLPTPERTPSPPAEREVSDSLHRQENVNIQHSAGSIDVDVDYSLTKDRVIVNKCGVLRTARRLFQGTVFYYQ